MAWWKGQPRSSRLAGDRRRVISSRLHNFTNVVLLVQFGCLQVHLNTNYCLEPMQCTLTDELEDTPPPLHAWTSPVVEDMLQEVRAGLMEADGYWPYEVGCQPLYIMGDVPCVRESIPGG